MRSRSVLRRAAAAVVLTSAVVLAFGPAASAHVTVSPGESAANGYTVLTFSVPHGCEELPTTEVKIQIPESIPQVTPTVNPNWQVEKVMTPLDEPVDTGEGEALTERVSEVVYTATTPLPDGLRDSFELSMKMPDTPDETLYFPVVQVCEGGAETAWIEIPEEGATEEPEHPAPAVTLTAAEGDGHGGGDADEAETEADAATVDAELAAEADDTAAGDDSDDGSSNTLAIIAIVIGVAGLAVGGVALARSSRA
jgi:uncharacterized protein YcnI